MQKPLCNLHFLKSADSNTLSGYKLISKNLWVQSVLFPEICNVFCMLESCEVNTFAAHSNFQGYATCEIYVKKWENTLIYSLIVSVLRSILNLYIDMVLCNNLQHSSRFKFRCIVLICFFTFLLVLSL